MGDFRIHARDRLNPKKGTGKNEKTPPKTVCCNFISFFSVSSPHIWARDLFDTVPHHFIKSVMAKLLSRCFFFGTNLLSRRSALNSCLIFFKPPMYLSSTFIYDQVQISTTIISYKQLWYSNLELINTIAFSVSVYYRRTIKFSFQNKCRFKISM